MAYSIEFALSRRARFYAEFIIRNKNTNDVLQLDDVEHQFVSYGWQDDYGLWTRCGSGTIIASTTNGMIVSPEAGMIAVNIPATNFSSYRRHRFLKCHLLAIPADDANFTEILADISIFLTDHSRARPRMMEGATPIYPNKPSFYPAYPGSASAIPPLSVAVKTLNNEDYTISAPYAFVGYATLSAAHQLTLPKASAYPVGPALTIADQSGSCDGTKTITILPHAGDTIGGDSSVLLNSAYKTLLLYSDGISKWTY